MADRNSFERTSSEIATSPRIASAVLPDTQGDPASRNARESFDDETQDKSARDESSIAYENVLQSDIGVNTLLNRLKQSIASARDFAGFLKKRSSLEEEHAQTLKKLNRSAAESIRRPDSRQGSYARNFEDITRIHDRMADNGIQFALSLHQMHEDLQELAADKERGRKQWKLTGLTAEKRVQDSESAMEKAKAKYNSLAEDYDRARTGDRQSGRFGLKGPKSAAQVEEDLNRKMQTADGDYASKVQIAQSMRQELVSSLRPQAIKALEQLVHECDSGLTLQMQKFATFNEKLLLSNGLCISPLKDSKSPQGLQTRSLRDIVSQIDNEQDLKGYVAGFSTKVGPKPQELRYEPHHAIQPPQPTQLSQLPLQQSQSQFHIQQAPTRQQPPPVSTQQSPAFLPGEQNLPAQHSPGHGSAHANTYYQGPGDFQSPGFPSPDQYSESPKQHHMAPVMPTHSANPIPSQAPYGQPQYAQSSHHQLPYNQPPYHQQQSQTSLVNPTAQNGASGSEAPAKRPVFGFSLQELFARDGSAVPMVVYQCVQAVDLYGLDVEGIYRLSGTTSHINKLRSIFDNDPTQLDFRNPEAFYHDVNSVAGLLKQFFRDLPDPLLTTQQYGQFIEAARLDDDIARRDALHLAINTLPDPNYATLRTLALHLHRVQEHSSKNRMNAGNLAICFAPTLMVSNGVPNIADAGWQVRAVDTILQNTLQIFDDD